MKARALGREKVWHASSFSAKYASASTIFPAHLPQIRPAPINSRAQVIGSRRKKGGRMIRVVTRRSFLSRRIRTENRILKTGAHVINRQFHVRRNWFSLAKRGNKSCPAEVSE